MKTLTVPVSRLFFRLGLIFIWLTGLFGALPPAAVRAATLTVTTSADGGAGSLRQAIIDAASGDTIVFHSGLSGQTITVLSTLSINKNLTIDGSALASQITISGAGAVRIFLISGVNTLKNLKIVNGSNPGGDGGAITNSGILTVTNCTISNNLAGRGGGIYNGRVLVVNNSTFANNQAVFDGNYWTGSGGAIHIDGAEIHVTNSSFYGNSARIGGGVSNSIGPANYVGVVFTNNTFIANTATDAGGGIYNGYSARIWIYNNIMAYSYQAGDCYNTQGTIVDQHNNYIMNNPYFGCGPSLYGDPFVTGLGDYGGPTQTMALLPGSVGFNTGYGPLCPATDQRGVARPQGATCDVGSYEQELPVVTTAAASGTTATGAALNATVNARFGQTTTSFEVGRTTSYGSTVSGTPLKVGGAVATPVSAAIGGLEYNRLYHFRAVGVNGAGTVYGSDQTFTTLCGPGVTVQNTNDSGDGSLRQALLDTCAGGVITFNPALSGQTIRLAAQIALTRNITIDGSALAAPLTLSGDSDGDGSGNVRIFLVNSGVNATLKNLILTKGHPSNNGSALRNDGTLTLLNCTFTASTTSGSGGAVYNTATLTVANSTFSQNTTTGAGTYGGAIHNTGTLTVASSTFSGNSSFAGGGAISNSGSLDVTNATFSANTSPLGGGLYNWATRTATLLNSTFSGNAASTKGGAVYNEGTLNLTNTILANSTAGFDCHNSGGTIGANLQNLVETNSGCAAPVLTSDPNLGTLANNGGPTHTLALLTGSPAISAGDAPACPALDQRGALRPQGAACDIGALEYDVTPPSVTINQADGQADPADGLPITFTVVFSEPIDPATFTTADILQGGTATGITWQIADAGAHSTFTLSALTTSAGTLTPSLPAGSVQDFSLLTNTASTASDNSVTFCSNTATVTSAADSGPGTLRARINEACSGGTINFSMDLSGQTVALASSLVLSKNVTINGYLDVVHPAVTLSGQNAVRVFQVNESVTANLSNLSLANGSQTRGAAIHNAGTLTLTQSALFNNSASEYGGAIYSTGTLMLGNTSLYANSAAQKGGAVYNAGTLVSKNNTLSENTSTQGAGLFNAAGASLDLANTLITGSTGGDCVNQGTLGLNSHNLVEDGSCSAALSGDPLLAVPGNYYGAANTVPLLPGSIAIDAGDMTVCTTSPVNGVDQRGLSRPEITYLPNVPCDIGAYESRGTFILIEDTGSGNNQAAAVNTPFNQPLRVAIHSRIGNFEPLVGGKVTFTPPASGPGAAVVPIFATIFASDGSSYHHAEVNASANGLVGAYQVNANTIGARVDWQDDNTSGVNFTLANCLSVSLVTSIADFGPGSLRQAIIDTCANGTVNFDAALSGQTIPLASTLNLNKNIVIDASALAERVILSGENLVRVFKVEPGVNAVLKDLTVTRGNASTEGGGGVLNKGTLSVMDSLLTANNVTSNVGAAINNNGTLTVTSSTFSNNTVTSTGSGGAINNTGTLSVVQTSFFANVAIMFGGAIYSASPITVAASSFTNNSTNLGGGAIAINNTTTSSAITGSTFSGNSANIGGAILGFTPLTVTNSTFSGNTGTLTGGGIHSSRAVTLVNSTFSGNNSAKGGGIYVVGASGILSYSNTILANSTSGQDCFIEPDGSVATNVQNLVETSTGCGTPAFSADPLLGALADNGGPTRTFALLAGSPALTAGAASACPAADQRGVARPQGSACDIGAFELEVPTALTLPVSNRVPDGVTLNALVNAKNTSTTVTFEYGLDTGYGTTVTAAQSPVTGTLDTPVSYALSGLSPDLTYHYRVVTVNAAGTTYGADMAFSLTLRIYLPVISR